MPKAFRYEIIYLAVFIILSVMLVNKIHADLETMYVSNLTPVVLWVKMAIRHGFNDFKS